MANNKISQKISYRVSFLWIISLLLGLLFLGFFLQGYFNFKLIEGEKTAAGVSAQSDLTRFLVSGVLFFLLTAICFFVFFRIIIKPLGELTGWCNEIKEKKLIAKKIESDIREINQLANAINEMVDDLKKSHDALEESKTVLGIKVNAKTKQLQELAGTLEEKVKQRTSELREKVDELEKLNKLSIGRELKMLELKDEIKKLKEESAKSKLS